MLGRHAKAGTFGGHVEAAVDLHQHRPEERNDEEDHRKAVHQTAQQDQRDEEEEDDRVGLHPRVCDPLRRGLRQADARHENLHQFGAKEDQIDHASRPGRLFHRLQHFADVQPPFPGAVDPDQKSADSGGGGRVKEPAVDAAKDEAENDHDGDDPHRRLDEFLAVGGAVAWPGVRLDRDIDRDGQDEEDHRQRAGDHRGGEHGDDVRLDDDGVDDEDDRRRDQDSKNAARRQRPCRQRAGIIVPLQLRQGDLAHGGGGGEGRSADRPEPGAPCDGRHGRAAPHPSEPCVGPSEQRLTETRPRGERAHQHEHRHDGQRVDGELPPCQRLELAQDRRGSIDDHDADAADQDHRIGDWNADRDQRDQHDEAEDAKRYRVHNLTLCPSRAPYPAESRKR